MTPSAATPDPTLLWWGRTARMALSGRRPSPTMWRRPEPLRRRCNPHMGTESTELKLLSQPHPPPTHAHTICVRTKSFQATTK